MICVRREWFKKPKQLYFWKAFSDVTHKEPFQFSVSAHVPEQHTNSQTFAYDCSHGLHHEMAGCTLTERYLSGRTTSILIMASVKASQMGLHHMC
mmetsp:Transcript_9961/g.24663  ORF Transcript_9961/g.24663 Transcript_9961/m.24663 type:complete len:95 (+) Transcript_9961:160-444(+)